MKKIELSEHRTTFEIEIILNTIKAVFKVTALNDIGTLMLRHTDDTDQSTLLKGEVCFFLSELLSLNEMIRCIAVIKKATPRKMFERNIEN